MQAHHQRLGWLGLGVLWAVIAGVPAMAEDVELFVATSNATYGTRPNILLIIDDSGSMDSEIITQENYDPSTTYGGSCSANRVYWRTGSGEPPNCSTDRWFERSSLRCQAALNAFAQPGGGIFIGRAAQFDPTSGSGGRRWETISNSQHSRLVECQADEGIHGDGVDATRLYPQNGNGTQPWRTTQGGGGFRWGQSPANQNYTLFDGNYLNWYYGPTGVRTRLEVVQDVANGLLNVISEVNIGIMNFNFEEGGSVIYAMEDIETGRAAMQSTISGLKPSNWTPLSETLYEATQYYMGGKVDYGSANSVAASRDPNDWDLYQSPLELSCQKNFVVLLTDGEPTRDRGADNKILSLPNFASLVGSCDAETYPPGFSPDGGNCLDDLAEYLYKADLSDLPGQQNVTTYTIGFTVDLPILADAAQRGGGQYYTADDTASLSTALTNIVTSILDTSTTFVSPAVSVNSFNRTQNLNDLYISVFQPSGQAHWPGNLKKYRLRPSDATLIDVNGVPAVDEATGFFTDTSQSYWSSVVDGSRVNTGGAASRIPDPTVRRVYTYLGNPALTDASNRVAKSNAAIDDGLLNTGVSGDPTRDNVIDFINGWDMADHDQDNNTDEPRNQMGDPLHTQPIAVIYGPGNDVATLYFATNDGFLHAIDPNTGVEKWAFIPEEFLGNQIEFYKNESRASKLYGIDGSLRVQTLANQDGVIDSAGGEKVYLYFGVRRGGDFYYALDVTDPDQPAVLWRLGNGDLPGVGQSWANPVPVRVNIQGATQNSDKLALVLGGGYDPSQDSALASTDDVGNSIYIVDSVSGSVLWHASRSGATQDFAAMEYSIPADPKVIDLNSDGFADRMYVSDMGGQVWRFDLRNGSPADAFATGGVIARLGAAGQASPSLADTRRFYYPPDVAVLSSNDQSFMHIGIGSGYRSHPNSLDHHDRFYALRDYNTFNSLTQAQYDALTPITDADLIDVTDDVNAEVPYGNPGWRFELRDGGWRGEKVLAEARTFNNQVFFTTFTPSSGTVTGCEPRLGTNRLYVMSLFNGAPVNNLDGSVDEEDLTASDRYQEFPGSITSEVVFIFPSPEDPDSCVGDECTPNPVAFVGLFGFLPPFLNNPVRTFWSEESTQ